MRITFLGATRTVTGSKYLVETKKRRFLIDCGMYQGTDIEERNYKKFTFDPRNIDFVILTHAHLDHCGLLPKLYKDGFRGQVYMTPPTRYIVDLMLMDSAKIQEIRFQQHQKMQRMKGWALKQYDLSRISIQKPIYDSRDAIGLLRQTKIVRFGEKIKNSDEVSFSFFRAGHALGAASVKLYIHEEGKTQRIVFSGDLGNPEQHLDRVIEYPKDPDYVVMESLYGGREHPDRSQEEDRFIEKINNTLSRGGNVIIPSFTFQRSQELLYVLKMLISNKKIPSNVRVYLDSPLALSVTEGYKRYFRHLNPEIIKSISHGNQLFTLKNFVFVRNSYDSRKIRKKQGSIIIAGSGMCVGGRVLSHLTTNLPDKKSSIIFVGFQAPDTLGREIIGGAQEVSIDDKIIPVKAEIVSVDFSAHAGNRDLLTWIGHVDPSDLKRIFLVHAEEHCSEELKKTLRKKGYHVTIPQWKKEYILH